MQESFEQILKTGGHTNSLGRTAEVLQTVADDHSKIDELFACISADDAWVRMRAIDTFEKLVRDNPELAAPYLSRIIRDLTQSSQPSVQWHLAQIFGEIELSERQRSTALKWLTSRLVDVTVDWIVSVNTMKTLLKFQAAGYIRADELKPLFEIQIKHTSNSVRKKAAGFIEELSN